MKRHLFTSESVTEGHPDKVCDKISDSVLDALLAQDPLSRVALETCCNTGFALLTGEITTTAHVDYEKIKKMFIEVNQENDGNNTMNAKAESKLVLENLDKVLGLLNSGKSFTSYELEKELMLSKYTIHRYIDKLLKEGVIIQTGTKRFARYKKA